MMAAQKHPPRPSQLVPARMRKFVVNSDLVTLGESMKTVNSTIATRRRVVFGVRKKTGLPLNVINAVIDSLVGAKEMMIQ